MMCFPAYDLHQFFNIVLYKICVVYIYMYIHICVFVKMCVCMLSFLLMIDAAHINIDWERSIDYRLL